MEALWRDSGESPHGEYTSHLWVDSAGHAQAQASPRRAAAALNIEASIDGRTFAHRWPQRRARAHVCRAEMVAAVCLEAYLPLRHNNDEAGFCGEWRPCGWCSGKRSPAARSATVSTPSRPSASAHPQPASCPHSLCSDLMESGVHLAQCTILVVAWRHRPRPCVMCTRASAAPGAMTLSTPFNAWLPQQQWAHE